MQRVYWFGATDYGGGTPTMSPFFVPLLHSAIGLGGSHSGGGNFLKLKEASAFAIVCGVLNITQLIARIRDAWMTHADTAFLRDAPAGVLWRAQLAAGRSQAEVDNGYVPAAPDDQEVVAIVNQGCFPTRSRGYGAGAAARATRRWRSGWRAHGSCPTSRTWCATRMRTASRERRGEDDEVGCGLCQ